MSKQAIETIGVSALAEPRPRMLLLVVNDPAIHELVQQLLVDTEWIVDCVKEGEDTLARLEVCSYDLILTDLMMLGMNPPALLSHLRKRHPEARTVVMTVTNALSDLNPKDFRVSLLNAVEHRLFRRRENRQRNPPAPLPIQYHATALEPAYPLGR